MTTRADFAALVTDDILPSRMPDVGLLRAYLEQGCRHGDPLCLSFGETWNQAPAGLLDHLHERPLHAHGYQLSMYGLPKLRKVARDYVTRSHRLEAVAQPGRDFEVAATWTGTRGAMFDFGRYLLDELGSDGRVPVVVAAGPSWDYEGVFHTLGYQVRYLPLRPETGFRPMAGELQDLADRISAEPGQRLAMVVVNAQHNPTAVNWRPGFVAAAVDLAHQHGAGLLVDDAYFGVHDPEVEPTSALRVLLSRLPGAPPAARRRWLAVRSLGKQFHCNGWGLGLMTAEPATLDLLVNRYRLHSSLMYGGVYQHAMADWLADPASTAFLAAQCAEYAAKRRLVDRLFSARLGYPAGAVHTGSCTSYLLFALPAAYAGLDDGEARFRDEVFARTGVLFAPAWPWPYAPTAAPLPYMRMYLGPGQDVLTEAVDRLAGAGIQHGMAVSR
ncbi:pyridoxal phosphate-dependent aminotransferase [Crossiella sp. SN42]|uniref:aminotransferase class I/II-fold pyridoxal phosphate-dependent enzyme n=1 Tax=Crossiella sp. SN42 TaxID=2944808 RepID=UPI00207CFD85|nr:pyridoxal phosphate-dependent aminotransferase [Crossiella sp. SN42]MCO1578638.1 pyridoxal phosphate-dependent aminotransferase [Crossiella sp. SN42]